MRERIVSSARGDTAPSSSDSSRAVFRFAILTPLQFAILLVFMLAANLGALIVSVNEPRYGFEIVSNDIVQETGLAFTTPVPDLGRFPFEVSADDLGNSGASSLKLSEDGRRLGPPHASHADIRAKGAGRYSHWGGTLYFSTGDGSDPRSNGRVYSVSAKSHLASPVWIALALANLAALVLFRRYFRIFGSQLWELAGKWPVVYALPRLPYFAFRLCGALALASCIVYAAASLYALLVGWALPTTALIRWSRLAEWTARHEPYVPYLVLSLAAAGALGRWLAFIIRSDVEQVERDDAAAIRLFRNWGLPVLAGILVLSISALWTEISRQGDLQALSIAGLVPFNDANGHFSAAHDLAKNGVWQPFALRRPFAASFRSVLLAIGGFSYASTLLVQTLLLATAAWFATVSIMKWRGLWAGLAFLAFTYIYARIWPQTFLTETLGLIWALVALPFFVSALRLGSAPSAVFGLTTMTVALLTRMGSMFTVPALVVWTAGAFATRVGAKLRLAALCLGIVALLFILNKVLVLLYSDMGDYTGSNFLLVLCGLSIGTTWEGCVPVFQDHGLSKDSPDLAIYFSILWENIARDPSVITGRLFEGLNAFFQGFSGFLWRGYGTWTSTAGDTILALSVAAAAIQRVVVLRERNEIAFWVTVLAGLLLSVPFVYFDDGTRILAASYPLVFAFLAMAFAAPKRASLATQMHGAAFRSARISPRFAWAALCTALASLLVVPWLTHALSPAERLWATIGEPSQDHVIFGGRRMTGVLVVGDDEPLRTDVPTLHLSDFKTMVARSGVEIYQGLVNPISPRPPFAFLTSPRLEPGSWSGTSYIAPPDVLERRDVSAWRFKIQEWQRKPPKMNYWFLVTRATPLP